LCLHCSKSGLMSYEFDDPGVYYYSDQGYNEAAPYAGTIIVKPKVEELFVELSQDGFSSGKSFLCHKMLIHCFKGKIKSNQINAEKVLISFIVPNKN